MGDADAVSDPRWYEGEPIWVTAERQGLSAATMFWVGSEAPIGGVRPTRWVPYDGRISNAERGSSSGYRSKTRRDPTLSRFTSARPTAPPMPEALTLSSNRISRR